MKPSLPFLLLLLSLLVFPAHHCLAAPEPGVAQVTNDSIKLPLSDSSLWHVDTTHLGTKQVRIAYLDSEEAAILTPTWAAADAQSDDVAIRNIDNSCLYLYQMIQRSDCTQSESSFEVSVPPAYVQEGRLDFIFSLQGGKEDDYLFNGKMFTMKDFSDAKGGYKKVLIKASDFNEPDDKRRGIQRVGFTFHRNGSLVSAPIRIRRLTVTLNSARVVPPPDEADVVNPASSYTFNYTNKADVARLQTKVSNETMDITRRLSDAGASVALTPLWKDGQVPTGHTGNVYVGESLGAPHNFERFEVRYVLNIPKAYFVEGKLDLYLCIQAGESGYFRWSGVQRPLASFADKAGQEVVLVLNQDDFKGGNGKKRNRIEFVGLQLNRHGSTVTEPILLKEISVRLP